MPERILVAYASHTGSTAEIAAAIGVILRRRGYEVDLASVTESPSLEGCAAVLIGSAVNGGQWLPEAVDFVCNSQRALGKVPVALFTVHIMNAGADERSRRKRLAYLDAVRPVLHPVNEAFFLGMGPDPKKDSWIARWFFRLFGGAGEGDCRDWVAIRSWARTVLAVELEESKPSLDMHTG
jgi:menaquinone-dependent protoporphyrinogen oxidase